MSWAGPTLPASSVTVCPGGARFAVRLEGRPGAHGFTSYDEARRWGRETARAWFEGAGELALWTVYQVVPDPPRPSPPPLVPPPVIRSLPTEGGTA